MHVQNTQVMVGWKRPRHMETHNHEIHGLRPSSITTHVDYGPRRKRTMLNAAHILLQTPHTDVRGESIFISFQIRSTCNCFHTFHNEIMYNAYIDSRSIIIWKCWLLCGLLHIIQIVISTIRKVAWSSCQNIRTCAKLSLIIQGGHYP